MLVSEGAWMGDAEKCPADYDFVAYLESEQVEGASIFLMGSGGHHLVGRACATKNNSVIAVTNSREEMIIYAETIEREPEISRLYKLWYCDVHMLDARQLPRFDFVSLPHLGEMSAPAPYAHLSIADVIDLMSNRLYEGGGLVFYRRSAAWDKISGLIDSMLSSGWESEEYASLIILRRTA